MAAWTEYTACAVCAISGVLAASGKNMDLFGAIMLALATALGGGTLRDLCLDVTPIFWIQTPAFLIVSLIAAVATFFLAARHTFRNRALNIADAFGLALFGIIGTEKALAHSAPASVAVFMGILTAVAGGIIRDVLRNEIPVVFRRDVHLYATAVFGGAAIFVLLQNFYPAAASNRYIGMIIILALRLAAIRWRIALPAYQEKG